jgi:hypothetical protein
MKRRYRFRESMLRGHPSNVTRAVKRVVVHGDRHQLVVTSTTDGGHARTSFHFTKPRGRAVDLGNLRRREQRDGKARVVGANPGTAEARRLMVKFQRFLVAKFGCSAFTELFGPDNSLNCKNGRRLALDEGSALETAHDTHVHVTPSRLLPLPKRTRKVMAFLRRERLIRRAKRRGAKHVRVIFKAAEKHNVSYALALALFQHESNFINQYGHDRDRLGRVIWHGKDGLVKVTRRNYRDYKAFRRRTGKAQGVGLGQLTSPGYQDRADARGGCWRTKVNVDVSLEVLAGHIKALGTFKGVGAYNGGRGNPVASYARAVLALRDRWRDHLHPERSK